MRVFIRKWFILEGYTGMSSNMCRKMALQKPHQYHRIPTRYWPFNFMKSQRPWYIVPVIIWTVELKSEKHSNDSIEIWSVIPVLWHRNGSYIEGFGGPLAPGHTWVLSADCNLTTPTSANVTLRRPNFVSWSKSITEPRYHLTHVS